MAFFWARWRNELPQATEEYQRNVAKLREQAPIPCIWLFGKTGSGKSSIVRYLTGAEEAVIGAGYRPQTKTSRRFDFPDSTEPLLRFLDTRGLAEPSYDPQEDIVAFMGTTHLMIVAVRIADHALESVITPLRRIRQAAPTIPVVLVLTCLHEAIGREDISATGDAFQLQLSSQVWQADQAEIEAAMPAPLGRLVAQKVVQFAGLHDDLILVDLTKPEDGFADPDFGGQCLKGAILKQLPLAYRQALLTLNECVGPRQSNRHRNARWQVLASSALAATAGAVPIPWVDIPAVMGIQAHLAVKIAKIHGQELTPARWAVLSSAAGSRIAIRMAVREMLKFIPVLGMAVGAAGAFAFTYALGMSWDWYFGDLRKGNVPSAESLKEVFAEHLKRGHELWRAE